jgi:hypothetical protein
VRFYRITITNPDGTPAKINGVPLVFSSHNDAGKQIPGALQVEFDLPVVAADVPAGNGFVKIWGVPLEMVNQAASLNLKNIKIEAGMMGGLPLAREQADAFPIRRGVIFQGSVFQSFGNWQGTEQSLDLIVTVQLSPSSSQDTQTTRPMIFQCAAGQSFQDALDQSLNAAAITHNITVDPGLVPANPIIFQHDNMQDFATDLLRHSKRINKSPGYLGVKMVKTQAGYNCSDNSTPDQSGIAVNFKDLIGQPTWLDLLQMQMRVVMRSDIAVGTTIAMPKQYIDLNNAKRVFGAAKEGILFTGTGWVNQVRHIANFRHPDANSWVTILDVILNAK